MSSLRRRASWTEEDERAEVREIIRLREVQKQKAEERKKEEEARRKALREVQKQKAEERKKEEEARRKAIQDITRRVSRAKKDKELEALAQEVGALQAQPDYVKEYGRGLDDLQAQIEEKYSLVGKGMRYLKKLFSRGKRASQIRTTSRMNRELQREIRALKRDLNK